MTQPEISDEMQLARVADVDDTAGRAVLEFPSGAFATVSNTGGFRFGRGATVFVEHESGHIEEAPPELWPDPPWVGVVRIKHSDVTVVEIGSGYRLVPTTDEPSYEVGNTVAGRDKSGIYRILDPKPLRMIDLSSGDSSILATFKPAVSAGLTFADFAGLPQVVMRTRELVEAPLNHRDKLQAIKAKPIKGVLFTGPPGTGKTLLARIIAHEASAEFYEISGPQIFSKWVGESEAILRTIFEDAASKTRSIIFFDEIDSVAGQREGAHEASVRVVAQLLTLMDGFTPADNVVVIAATNRPDDIDIALRRPGRFDVEIHFPLPSIADRQEILAHGARSHTIQGELPLETIAQRTDGWSGAELTAIWGGAALLAALDGRGYILADDLIGGFDRVTQQHGRVVQEAK